MAVSSINNNIPSLKVDRSLSKNAQELKKGFNQLSSGLRINKASDDAAGLAIATELLTNARIDDSGTRNISDAISAANIAEGALQSAADITSRLGELATQASNGTLSASQRTALNSEFQALRQELDRVSQTTEFNGLQLLGGNTKIGVQAGGSSQLSISFPGVNSAALGIASDLSSQENAQAAVEEARNAVESLAKARGQIGADVARLDTAFENLRSASVNSREAASRILDANLAEVSARLSANKIQQQASVAVKAQANIQPENVLRLIS
jgi:flagellin